MRTRLLFVLLVAAAATLALGAVRASADPDANGSASGLTDPAVLSLIATDQSFATADLTKTNRPDTWDDDGARRFGPYSSTSTDSGTCGIDWANDTFDRIFYVLRKRDGSIVVVEQFANGRFVTMPVTVPSPGSCDATDGTPPGVVGPNIKGSFFGYFVIPLPPATTQTSNSRYCNAVAMTNANCTTTTFINTHFAPPCYPGTCPVTTFYFLYSARDQGLINRQWRNASADRGGNRGDIRSGP
jgi:hypothetical protein